MKINKDKESDSLTGISDFSLNHTISPFTRYTITQIKDKTNINGNWKLFKNQNHYLSLFTLLNIDTCEEAMTFGLKTHLRYHFNNHTMISAGIEDFQHAKETKPNLLSFYLLHGHGLENGLKVYGGLYTCYLIQERMVKYQRLMLSLKNGTFNSLFNLSLNRKKEIEETQSEKTAYDKIISLKIINYFSNSLTIGGNMEFNINDYSLSNRLFSNYYLDQDTLLKTKWEDNDKSVTLTLNHNFRGIIRFGVSGKFNVMRNSSISSKCPIPIIKTKFGLFAEINETLI